MNNLISIIKKFINKNSFININNNQKKDLNQKNAMFYKEEWDNWFYEDNTKFSDEYQYYKNNCCPNCGLILEKKLSSSKKCFECKKNILVRTNYKTKQKLYIGEDKAKEYEKLDKVRKEINFCEQHLKKMFYGDEGLLDEFNYLKKQKPGQSVRDYFWMFCMNKTNEITNSAYKLYMKSLNEPYHKRALEFYDVIFMFQRANVWFNYMIGLVEFEKKDNVLMTMLPRAIHLGISVELLYEQLLQQKIDKRTLSQLNCSDVLLKYIERNNLTIKDFQKIYIEHASNLIIPTIEPQDAWKYVEKGIKELYERKQA